jgi:gamma-glutamyl:cysteine ligase YbdK (ATP-grasp superfamily)
MVDRTEELISQLRQLDAQRVAVMQELKKLRMDHHARILGALHAGRAPWEIQTTG